ncbi:hypothetical protein TVAGG3_0299310 [Trichomonas vaginalis G3]|uniref:hypothetical protein n=1 Tax=Trichomonas vaginalis (strain ATCC PRA-98 / G3) TaxID=412133 RepID=UPI0021E5BD00|nr:hypothetical protein TVAGG3_0299310 [Trichomonas vaginalis G3]KAI5527780.1 hypothetical protein TVAGG3_0299310 [Trichomonas vaginalis G3]
MNAQLRYRSMFTYSDTLSSPVIDRAYNACRNEVIFSGNPYTAKSYLRNMGLKYYRRHNLSLANRKRSIPAPPSLTSKHHKNVQHCNCRRQARIRQ